MKKIPHYTRYIGYAKNSKIRAKGASGGVATSLLVELLENKLIDGAIVVRMNKLEPEQFIAKTKEEIIGAAQSKYIDFNLANIIKILKNVKGRFAIMGLPCQFMALKKIPFVREKIKYWFGLYCGHGLKKEGTLALIKKLNIDPKQVVRIDYRAGTGYGGIKITTKDGKHKFVSKDASNYLFTTYLPDKCVKCKDLFNEYADVSFGDCWFKKKYTSILIMTPVGKKVISESNSLHLEKIDQKKFFDQHKHSISLKKKRIDLRKFRHIFDNLPFWLLSILAKIAKIMKRLR